MTVVYLARHGQTPLNQGDHLRGLVDPPLNKTGQEQVWSVEWGGGAQLTQEHVTRDTLKSGDHVVVSGNPGRDPNEHRIRLHKIVRTSDGWTWEGVIM